VSADTVDEGSEPSPFLDSIEFLTGEDPSAGSFLLVVGIVTCVFVAGFQFTLSKPISTLLTGLVLAVAVISFIMGAVLDALDYFDRAASETTDDASETEDDDKRVEWATSEGAYPLPPIINFDDELGSLKEHFDGELPDEMGTFVEEYSRLKTTAPGERTSVASDLRAALNPIPVLVDDPALEETVEEMGEQLFEYIQADGTDLLTVVESGFYEDDDEATVASLQEKEAQFKARIANDGEGTRADIVIVFTDDQGTQVRKAELPISGVPPAAEKTLETSMYVPSTAQRATVTAMPVDTTRNAPDT
jgi:hypothetical protein